MNRQRPHIRSTTILLRSALLLFTIQLTSCTTAEVPLVEHHHTVEDLPPRPPSTQITLDQAVHFQTPQGEPIVVAAGTYEIRASGDRALQVTGTADGAIMRIAATPSPQTYLIDQREPVAIALAGTDEDSHHILYAHTDGTALDAAGSYSGIQSRAGFALIPHDKAQAALTSKVAALAAPPRGRSLHTRDDGGGGADDREAQRRTERRQGR